MKTIQQDIEEYLHFCENVKRMSKNTITIKKLVLTKFSSFIDYKKLSSITNDDINKFIDYLTSIGLCARTINTYTYQISTMIKWQQSIGKKCKAMTSILPKQKEINKPIVFYTREQIKYVVNHADDISGLMIRIAFDTGMRLNEIRNIRLSSFDGNKIHYIGKGNIWHTTFISDETLYKKNMYVQKFYTTDYLFCEKGKNHPLSKVSVDKHMRKPFIECGYIDFHPHLLRHSFATDLQYRGASVEEIQKMIGHKNLITTQNYIHKFDNCLEELFMKYKKV